MTKYTVAIVKPLEPLVNNYAIIPPPKAFDSTKVIAIVILLKDYSL